MLKTIQWHLFFIAFRFALVYAIIERGSMRRIGGVENPSNSALADEGIRQLRFSCAVGCTKEFYALVRVCLIGELDIINPPGKGDGAIE